MIGALFSLAKPALHALDAETAQRVERELLAGELDLLYVAP